MDRKKFESGLSELGFKRTGYSNTEGEKKKTYTLEKKPIAGKSNYRTLVLTDDTGYRITHWYNSRDRVERAVGWNGVYERTTLAVFKKFFKIFCI